MAKIKYNENAYMPTHELYRVETGYRLSGGFNLDVTGLTAGSVVPPLAPISVDKVTRKATLLKRVRVVEAGSGKKVKVSKYANLASGMFLSNGTATLTIDSVDTSAEEYDTITAKADVSAFTKGAVLFEATAATGNTAKGNADYLTYAPVKVEEGATLTALGRAFEVDTDKLYIPVTEDDKKALTARFLFV